jgi:hypothetical protein
MDKDIHFDVKGIFILTSMKIINNPTVKTIF